MVLPGIQTLFGFQLIAVFSADFKANTLAHEQYLHLTAIILVSLAGVLVVAPAAYHRQANHKTSEHFLKVSGNFLSWALLPLAVGTCLDIYIVTRIILESSVWSSVVATFIFLIYFYLWFAYPRLRRKH